LESTLPKACSCETWEEAIETIQLNKYDTVDWALAEVFSGFICKNFKIFDDAEIANVSDYEKYMEFIYPIEGKNIMIRYSDRKAYNWNTSEFLNNYRIRYPRCGMKHLPKPGTSTFKNTEFLI